MNAIRFGFQCAGLILKPFGRAFALKDRIAEYQMAYSEQWQPMLEMLGRVVLELLKNLGSKVIAETEYFLQNYHRNMRDMEEFPRKFQDILGALAFPTT